MVRNSEKKLLQSYALFESLAEMVNKACDPVKPSLVKSLQKNRDKVDDAYQELFYDFRVYKEEVGDLDEKDEGGEDKFPHNSKWFEAIKDQYFALVDKSDEKLETLSEQVSAKAGGGETKSDPAVEFKEVQETKVRKLLETQMESESKAVKDSVTMVSNTVSALSVKSISTAQAQGYRNSLLDISSRLGGRMQKLAEEIIKISNDIDIPAFNAKFAEFVSLERARLDSIEMALVTKIKEDVVNVTARGSGHSSSHTYLKKQDPPSFSGDILDFPEFKRRWGSQVHSEKLEEQAELDRMRDNIPESAKKMLTGEKSLESAWKILTKLYGNKTMLANKLKAKLKNVKVSGKEDHDVVINLAIEVKSIVKSLTEMDMHQMLRHDDEYLSAIFRILPAQHRTKWLEFNKDTHASVWDAMEKFLDDAHEKATDTKVLLSNYAANSSNDETVRCKKCHEIGHKKFECPKNSASIAATRVRADDSDSDDNPVKKKEELKKKLKEKFGVCPVCKSRHSYKNRRDGSVWPSDRLSSCENFRGMSEKERAAVLEKHTSCSRCLSWIHAKESSDCKAPKSSCGFDKGGGSNCKGDHSRMVCGSGNAYYATANFSKSTPMQSTMSDSSDSDTPDIHAETMMLLEDVKVKNGSVVTNGRTLWDGGSSCVLVRNAYAKKMKFRTHSHLQVVCCWWV